MENFCNRDLRWNAAVLQRYITEIVYQKVVKFDDVLGLSSIYGIIKALIILLQELDNTIPDLTLVLFHI